MTASLTLFILASVFVTSLISGVLGMAGGMVLMGVLTWVLTVQQSMVLHATSQFFANGTRAVIHRKHIHTASTKYYLAGLALCFAAFSVISFVPSKQLVFALLGIGPFLPVLARGRIRFDFTHPVQAFVCGVLATCLQLTGGVSGSLLNLFFQNVEMTRHQTVATKAFTQTMSHVTKFVYFGMIVPKTAAGLPVWLYFAVIPIAIIGSDAGKHVLNRMTDHQFYKVTQWVLWVTGAVYLVKAALLAH